MGDSGTGLSKADPDSRSADHAAAVDREWAARRQELFTALEGSIRDAMASVLESSSQMLAAAAETQADMEREARIVVQRLEDDRRRLTHELSELRAMRERVSAEVEVIAKRAQDDASRIRDQAHAEASRITRGAHEDAARVRRTANQEQATIVREAEEHRSKLAAEIRQLEQQLRGVTERVHGILGSSDPPASASARADVEPSRDWLRAAAETGNSASTPADGSPAPTVDTRASAAASPERLRRDGGDASADDVGRDRAGTPTAPVRRPVAPRATYVEEAPPTTATARSARGPSGRHAEAIREVEAEPVRAWAASTSSARHEPLGTAVQVAPDTARHSDGQRGRNAADREAATSRQTVRIAIANTPNLGRALELQRAIQRTPGVRDVRAIQFEGGVLVLNVEHDSGLDIASEISSLPTIALERGASHDGQIELRFPDS